jgi:CRISPR/Cas system-associated exonuclease Cas4 (RecB family)
MKKTPINLSKAIGQFLEGKHNKNYTSKNYSLSPSVIGDDCMRKKYYSYFRIPQAPKKPDNIMILEGGNSMHEHFQKWLKEMGLLVEYINPKTKQKETEFVIKIPELKIQKGKVDGVLVLDGKIYLVELKSAGDAKFKYRTKEPQYDHKVQGTIYIFAFEKNLLEGEFDHIPEISKDMPVEGIIYLYVNRDTFKMKEFYIPRDEKFFLKICKDIEDLSYYIDRKELPPLKGGKLCKYCNFPEYCKNNRNVE